MNSVVSIIVPCFNHAQYLGEALQSVSDQSYTSWECIVVNDGSTDNTNEVAQQWIEKDSRFKYLEKINGGLSNARNAGISISSGEYILPLDADDKIGKDYLKEAVDVLDKYKKVKVIYAEAEYFGEKKGRWELPAFTLRGLAVRNIIYCSAIFRRSDFEKYGPYDESFTFGREDWDFWLSLLKDGGDVIRLPDVHFFYRKRQGGSMVDSFNNEKLRGITSIQIMSKHPEFYVRLFGDPMSVIEENIELHKTFDRYKRSKTFRLANFFNRKFKKSYP